MLNPIELRTHDGCVLIVAQARVPTNHRLALSSFKALSEIFGSPEAIAQLRRAWSSLHFGIDDSQHLPPSAMRRVLSQAVEAHRYTLLWLPRVQRVDLDEETLRELAPSPPSPVSQPSAMPRAMPAAPGASRPMPPPTSHLGAMPRAMQAAHPQSQTNVSRMSPREKLALALGTAFARLPRAVAEEFAQFDPAKLIPQLIVACAALGFVQAAGPLAPAIDGFLLAYGWTIAGWAGVLAMFEFATATGEAMSARSEADLDRAARKFTDVFEMVGAGLVGVLLGKGLGRVKKRDDLRVEPHKNESSIKSEELDTRDVAVNNPVSSHSTGLAKTTNSTIILSKRRFGHTFDSHGQNTSEIFLRKKASSSGLPQGQFLDDQVAARYIIDNLGKIKQGTKSLPVPQNFPARVFMPDGSIVSPQSIKLVPSGNGVRTAYPEFLL